MPQNTAVKGQWHLLEASRAEVEEHLEWLRQHGTQEQQDDCELLLALDKATAEAGR